MAQSNDPLQMYTDMQGLLNKENFVFNNCIRNLEYLQSLGYYNQLMNFVE